MKRILAVFLMIAIFATGCSSQGNLGNEIFNVTSSYFDDFTAERTENAYVIKGTVHNEKDGNAILIHIQAEKNTKIQISGTTEKSSGADTALVYVDADGTETTITDSSSEAFETTLNVTTGDGTVLFQGDPSVYDFEIQFELLDEVDYDWSNS